MEVLYEKLKALFRQGVEKKIGFTQIDEPVQAPQADRLYPLVSGGYGNPKVKEEEEKKIYSKVRDDILDLSDADFLILIPDLDMIFLETEEKIMASEKNADWQCEKLFCLSKMRHDLDKRRRELGKTSGMT